MAEHDTVELQIDRKPCPLRVLVVEEDGEMLALLGHVLREAGFTVAEAKEEAQAMVILEAASAARSADRALDAVVADVATLGAAGLRLVAGLRHPPAILLTASLADVDLESLALGVKAAAFFFKPFRLEDLLGALRSVAGARDMHRGSR